MADNHVSVSTTYAAPGTLANDMTLLLNKIQRRLGLGVLEPRLPEPLQKPHWADVVMEDSIVSFSRYFPNKFRLIVNDDTVDKKKEGNRVWYYIKDEILCGNKLLGVRDIDWTDTSANNNSMTNGSIGTYYYPVGMACPEATFSDILGLQMYADFSSLYNRGILIEFEYPNRFSLKGLANTNYDLSSFVVDLLVQHSSLSTISPTMMETFENLATCDVASFLYNELKYFDNLETIYVNIDLKLETLQDWANKRDNVMEEIKNAYVSAANWNQPMIMTV
ncbi:MAG: hypothetical protein IKR19_08760 [Acholeplasmatales bacterium]|nr:hypothetical protein [Acholeplasmatales bacterium]